MVVVRGDHELNEFALARALETTEVFLASDEDVEKRDEGEGRLRGPGGLRRRPPLRRSRRGGRGRWRRGRERDRTSTSRTSWFARDYRGEVASLRQVTAGDRCPEVRRGPRELPRHRGGAHLHPRNEVLAAHGRDVRRREAAAAASRDGLLRDRRVAPRGDDDRAAPRRKRHPLADERRAVPGAPRHDRQGRGGRRGRARPVRRARGRPASRSSGTTATSAPA